MLQVTLIEQNLAAQDNILAALTDAYAQTANIRKGVEEILKRREHIISSLIASYDAYEDLLAKSSKGLEFYRKLEINVSKLLQRVKSTCKVQEEEREHILAQDNKNSQEKIDTITSTVYDQSRNRTGSGLKLKDYLNSRPESMQNQYYNVYKGQGRQLQMDATTKSYLSNTIDKNSSLASLPSAGMPAPEAVSSPNPMQQQYYPTSYTDYKTNLPYSYDTSTYNENSAINSALNQNYVQINNLDTLSTYQQIPVTGTTTNITNTAAQYPVNSFASNGQFPAALDGQYKYSSNTHLQYNLPSNTLQYESYQPSMDYAGYNVAQQYPPNIDNTGNTVKTESREMPSNVLGISQSAVPGNAGASSVASKTIDVPAQAYTAMAPQGHYVPDPQQKLVSQEPTQSVRNQHVLPTDSPQIQNYTVPQLGQNEVSTCQNYSSRMYHNLPDSHTQQQTTSTQNMPGTNVASTPYMQTQYINANISQSIHSTTCLTATTNEISTSYSSDLSGSRVAQYPQQNSTEDKQIYIDKTYSYGSQAAVNDVALTYPSTYQSLQHGTSISYPQTVLPTETCNTYTYTHSPGNTEIIQSHAKSSTVQNYSETYQYPHYSGYAGYPNAYNQGYNYIQGNEMASTMSESYKEQMGYAYNPTSQCYEYSASDLQSSQPPRILQQPSEPTSQSSTAPSNVYPQQETNARYTNASNNSMVSQTPSSQYSGQPSESSTDIYYTTPYGLQMQNQGEYPKV